jgi:hypothetical protein
VGQWRSRCAGRVAVARPNSATSDERILTTCRNFNSTVISFAGTGGDPRGLGGDPRANGRLLTDGDEKSKLLNITSDRIVLLHKSPFGPRVQHYKGTWVLTQLGNTE